jgi:hypothetical protein
MQGLPIDELLLTRESEDNLRDLAGNAMTSTVVGTCIIAALIVGVKQLERGTGQLEELMDVDEEGIPQLCSKTQSHFIFSTECSHHRSTN